MKRIIFALALLMSALSVDAQSTFTFECFCGYLTPADSNCDICTSTMQSRFFRGILIKKNGVAYKWIEQPYTIKFSGDAATFLELIPTPEQIRISRLETPYGTLDSFKMAIQCPCETEGGGTTYFPGVGIDISGDTITNTGDLLVYNEGLLGVAAGGANNAIITSNTFGAIGDTISGGTGIGISETTSLNGGTITVTNTGDLLATNEGVTGVAAGGANDALLTSNTSGAVGTTFAGGAGIAISESTAANGGTITITNTSPATISGSGAANQFTLWSGANTLTGNAGFTYRILHRALELNASSANGNNRARFTIGGLDTVFNAASARFHSQNIGNSIRTSNTGQTISYLNMGSLLGTTSTINVDHNNTNLRLFQLTAPTVTIGGGVTGTSATGLALITGSSSFAAALRVDGNGSNNGIYSENTSTVHSLYYFGSSLTGIVQNLAIQPPSNGVAQSAQRFQNLRAGATGNGIGIEFTLNPTSGGLLSSYLQLVATNATAGSFGTHFRFANYFNNSNTAHLIIGSKGIMVNQDAQPTSTIHARASSSVLGGSVMDLENSNDSTIFFVDNSRLIGVNTKTPNFSVDMRDNTDGLGLQTGTTAQRTTPSQQIRFNTDVEGLELKENGIWYRITSSQAPSIAAGAAAGTGPTVTMSAGANDLGGQIELTTGTSCTTGTLATITFGDAFDASLLILVLESGGNAIANQQKTRWRVGSSGNTSFTLTADTALDDSTAYVIKYKIIQ